MLRSDLEGRDVAILGAGREGRSVCRWLRQAFPDQPLTVYDEKAVDWPEAEGLTVIVGPLDADRLGRHDILVRSPGISPYRPALRAAQASGVRITSASSLWFAAYPEARTMCITGTKGKSTTAALTAHLLRHAGQRVRLAGNIGTPLLDAPEDPSAWWVIELSSYQIADLEAQPTLVAILNLSDEHLDWHGGAANYRRDKLRLGELASDSPLVLNARDAELRDRYSGHANARWFGGESGWRVADDALWHDQARRDIPRNALRGEHNLQNLAAALTLLETAGIGIPDLETALLDFEGLPHRQQRLGEVGGVEFVSDSLATTPVATLAAIRAFRGRRVILLVGGLDRGLDWTAAIREMRSVCPHAIICLPDNGPRIAARMEQMQLLPRAGIHEVPGLEAGVALAKRLATAGDVVLLSPGAPSFPRFRDYAERGEKFAELARLAAGG